LKAFGGHPDPAVQLEAWQTLSAEVGSGRVSQWAVTRYFQDRLVRVSDAAGAFVYEAYVAAGGEIARDLIEEDSVLKDSALIEKCLRDKLSDLAEERRAACGLAWSEARTSHDLEELQSYGRVYPQMREMSEEEQAQYDALAERFDAIAAQYEAEGDGDIDAAEQEQAEIEAQMDALSQDYDAFDASLGGVIAIWGHGRVTYYEGMVRPADMPEREKRRWSGCKRQRGIRHARHG
jgi:ParB family chromosome partitioning protein